MFNSYRNKYENVKMKREDGILEIALHTRGGPLVFNGYAHEALVGVFRDIVIAAEDAYFQDAAHPAFGIVPGDGLHIVWPEVIGEIRGRYFLLSGQKLSAADAKEYGAVNEVTSRESLLPRAWKLARHMNKQNPLTLRYTRMALTNRFRRRVAVLNAQKAKRG